MDNQFEFETFHKSGKHSVYQSHISVIDQVFKDVSSIYITSYKNPLSRHSRSVAGVALMQSCSSPQTFKRITFTTCRSIVTLHKKKKEKRSRSSGRFTAPSPTIEASMFNIVAERVEEFVVLTSVHVQVCCFALNFAHIVSV